LGGNVRSTKGQAALTAVTDVMRVCLVHNRLLLIDVGSVKFLQLFFVIFVGKELIVFEFV